MQKITILGAGAFGFAMAKIVSENHTDKEFFLFDVQDKCIAHIHETRRHPIFHEDTKLPSHIHATTDQKKALEDADLIILAIPSKFLRCAVQDLSKLLTKDTIFLNVAKGLENNTNMRISEILNEGLKDVNVSYKICCLSGGMIAREVTLGNPLCADLACDDLATAKKVAKLISNNHLRVETSDDLIGVELSGAFKNVIAIGAGMFDGMGYSESSKSAFVSAAAKEMQFLAVAMGAKPETFSAGSQAWFGDLMTTCFGKSRNRELGEIIGRGIDVKDAVDAQIKGNKSIEGYITTAVVHNLVKEHNIKAPILKMIHAVLYDGKNPKVFITDFIKSW